MKIMDYVNKIDKFDEMTIMSYPYSIVTTDGDTVGIGSDILLEAGTSVYKCCAIVRTEYHYRLVACDIKGENIHVLRIMRIEDVKHVNYMAEHDFWKNIKSIWNKSESFDKIKELAETCAFITGYNS